ncbi:MAG: LysR family transcriptional regulator [Steroidobacteraceae bacterium]|jgi:DNA-binding transcriptional LysR family regulator|nr:LysR family transcriptional regulator [Steroidobacteraceae bacterium]
MDETMRTAVYRGHLEIRQLRQFMVVVDVGCVSKASEQLHITQPALTRNIKNLEESLNAILLERKPRGVVPTEAGLALYRYAHLILNEAKRAARDVQAIASGKRGHVHVGFAAMFAGSMAEHFTIALSDACPGVRLRITEGFFEELVAELGHGKLDVILSNFPPDAVPADARFEPLLAIRSNFVVGRSHPLACRAEVTAQDLCAAQWALVRRPHVADFLDSFFASQGFPALTGSVETNSLTTLKSLVMSGRYVSLLAEPWVGDEMRSGDIVALPVAGAPVLRQAGLITRDGVEQRPAVERAIVVLREVCAAWQAGQDGSRRPASAAGAGSRATADRIVPGVVRAPLRRQ